MRWTVCLGPLLFAGLGGCSDLIRGFVDTQPRVTVRELDLSDPGAVVRGEPVVYAPPEPSAADPGLDPDLVAFAPVLVQGFQAGPAGSLSYDRDDDAIGTLVVARDGLGVRVDAAAPRMYARVEHCTVGGVELKQLVYSFWYPSRPVGTIETGSVDGGVLRLTLDASGRPLTFEYAQPCGCFHGVFVAQPAEARAAQAFGPPAPDRLYSVEPPLTGRADWVVRDLVPTPEGGRATIYVTAGRHACEALRFRPADTLNAGVSSTRTYALSPYEALDRAPKDGGGEASIFDADGRVLGAKRGAEQLLMSDLDHAGWPRRLDRMLIHWDADRWNDPGLLDARLRLPAAAVAGGPPAPPGHAPATVTARAQAPAGAGRRLMLFTNAGCSGCKLTKRMIQTSPRLHALMEGWSYQLVDTATPEGERLAATHRVTAVPILLGFDGDRELFRQEEIATVDQIAATIEGSR